MRTIDYYTEVRKVADDLERERPDVFNLVCPRAYVVPPGYPSPRWNGALMVAQMLANHPAFRHEDRLNKTGIDCILNSWRLCECGVPTYFVGNDFASALVRSKPPGDFLIKHLKWPHEAMVFVLSESFALDYFGCPVPFVRVAHVRTGRQSPPQKVARAFPQVTDLGVGYEGEQAIIVTSTRMCQGVTSVDYSGSYSENDPVEKITHDVEFEDDIRRDTRLRELTTPQDDVEFGNKMMTLGVQLIMAMGALPQYIERETLERPERVKRGVVTRKALWRPRMFGGNYVIRRPKGPANGTHASPVLHYRKGHWRSQVCGVGRSERRLTWIAETWVGADDDVN